MPTRFSIPFPSISKLCISLPVLETLKVVPPAGTVLRRDAHGATHEVFVGEQSFIYGGETYRSLSAVAIKIGRTHQSGFSFFGLTKPWGGAQ